MSADLDSRIRQAAFAAVRRLSEVRGDLTSADLKAGFDLEGERIPWMNPQRGIFKPHRMRYLLSIRTVFPRSGAKVWYDDQRHVHQQIYQGDDLIDYAFMGTDPNAADNRWLREAMESRGFPKLASWMRLTLFPTVTNSSDSPSFQTACRYLRFTTRPLMLTCLG